MEGCIVVFYVLPKIYFLLKQILKDQLDRVNSKRWSKFYKFQIDLFLIL